MARGRGSRFAHPRLCSGRPFRACAVARGRVGFKDYNDNNDIKDAPKKGQWDGPLNPLRRSRPISPNWGKAPCAFAGCRGGASPCRAQRRHRGAARPLRPRCAIFARLAELAENTLAVLRRSRPWLTQKGVVFSLFSAEIGKLKIFLSLRLFHPFPLLLALFSKIRQFQITLLSSTTYIKNSPSPTRLQRLPRSQKALCDPL